MISSFTISIAQACILFIRPVHSKRIYDYLDNRKIICDYLTSKVFRLAEAHVPGKNDSNKSRRDNCAFWERLRSCRVDCFYIPSVERELVRTYARNLSSQVVKSRAVKAMVTYGIYAKGINDDDPKQDFIDALYLGSRWGDMPATQQKGGWC